MRSVTLDMRGMLAVMSRPPFRGRPWAPEDRTGGPLDDVLDGVRHHIPDLVVERITVKHAGDDDNVYFLGDSTSYDLVQMDSHEDGQPPFYIEGDDTARCTDVATAVAFICDQLHGEG
ncbi:hypothetical protein [Catellatospora sichuanensis]|uniref:hypothetical protein n=1 Tax=Catellatospora sichuanensis TaxID=1969805 RepID=UPI001642CA5C|nr:hypothetical protein [Catellatospora sichuanensis]